jgi:hypothetical protein
MSSAQVRGLPPRKTETILSWMSCAQGGCGQFQPMTMPTQTQNRANNMALSPDGIDTQRRVGAHSIADSAPVSDHPDRLKTWLGRLC